MEAAWTGEQGRGFEVVAKEVRSLGGCSAEAVKKKTLINTSVERIEHGAVLVSRAGGTMTDAVNSVKRVTDIMVRLAPPVLSRVLAHKVGEAVAEMNRAKQHNAAQGGGNGGCSQQSQNARAGVIPCSTYVQVGVTTTSTPVGSLSSLMGGHIPC